MYGCYIAALNVTMIGRVRENNEVVIIYPDHCFPNRLTTKTTPPPLVSATIPTPKSWASGNQAPHSQLLPTNPAVFSTSNTVFCG